MPLKAPSFKSAHAFAAVQELPKSPVIANEPPPGLFCRYSPEPVANLLEREDVLAVIGYEPEHGAVASPKYLFGGLAPFAGDNTPPGEVWYSDAPVVYGLEDDIAWSRSADFLFAAVQWRTTSTGEIRAQAAGAYTRLLSFIAARGYPHLIRIWNYLPNINRGEGDYECYRQFCHGRHQAFLCCGYPLNRFPSASALGHRGQDHIVYLIAARRPGRHFENPKQVSAYHYPRQYGSRSPSFARATLLEHGRCHTVFISGTASIVGHKTVHPECCERQLEVTFQNIETLLGHIGSHIHRPPRPNLLKVYVRHERHLALTRAGVQAHMGDVPALFLQGDICRRDLLVEVEGICEHNITSPQNV